MVYPLSDKLCGSSSCHVTTTYLLVIEHHQEQSCQTIRLKRAIAAVVLVSAFAAPVARSRMRLMRLREATTQRPCVLFGRWPMMVTPQPSTILGYCIWPARACSRTVLPQHYGFGKLQSKATPSPNPISGPCISTA